MGKFDKLMKIGNVVTDEATSLLKQAKKLEPNIDKNIGYIKDKYRIGDSHLSEYIEAARNVESNPDLLRKLGISDKDIELLQNTKKDFKDQFFMNNVKKSEGVSDYMNKRNSDLLENKEMLEKARLRERVEKANHGVLVDELDKLKQNPNTKLGDIDALLKDINVRKELDDSKINPLIKATAIPALGSMSGSSDMSPLPKLSEALNMYSDLKDKATDALSKQLDLSSSPEVRENIKDTLSIVADPSNLVPGAPGAALGIAEMINAIQRKKK